VVAVVDSGIVKSCCSMVAGQVAEAAIWVVKGLYSMAVKLIVRAAAVRD